MASGGSMGEGDTPALLLLLRKEAKRRDDVISKIFKERETENERRRNSQR
jgi:hypothetical protein